MNSPADFEREQLSFQEIQRVSEAFDFNSIVMTRSWVEEMKTSFKLLTVYSLHEFYEEYSAYRHLFLSFVQPIKKNPSSRW